MPHVRYDKQWGKVCAAYCPGKDQFLSARPREIPVENEVLGNIRNQRIGEHTVADLNLPEAFLRRVADRIIRESFWERHRVVVRRGSTDAPGEAPSGAPATTPSFNVIRAGADSQAAPRAGVREARPPLPGYRATLEGGEVRWPYEPPGESELAAAAAVVARRLAADGLLTAAARAMQVLGADKFRDGGGAAVDLLRRLGVPVDFLRYFGEGESVVVATIAARLEKGLPASALKRELAAIHFRFTRSVPGFAAHSESGETEAALVRAQVTGGAYWGGRGAGGSLDVLRQLLAALPRSKFLVSVEETHLDGVRGLACDWPVGAGDRVTLLPLPMPVAQWAQDNAKAGSAGGRTVMLLPRYASRGEDGSILVPGETFIGEGLRAAGVEVRQSPLLFQGGNLIVATRPGSRERLLLIGEAEVWRNTALGLTAEQATEALRIELGCDAALVLPAASFHIDYEVSVRPIGGELVGFVNDTAAATRIILEQGVTGLIASGAIDVSVAGEARGALRAGRPGAFLGLVGAANSRYAVGPGQYSEELAAGFVASAGDHAAGNLRVFLLALDLLAAELATPSGLPSDRHARAYLASFRRRDADRRQLHRKLEEARIRLVRVPSLSDGAIGPNAINGVHTPGTYLMPAWGGFYAPLDDAARAAYQAAMGESVNVVGICCAESQRRSGAVRCSVSCAGPG